MTPATISSTIESNVLSPAVFQGNAMDLNEALAEHVALHHEVTEYARKPDGSLKVDDLRAAENCELGRWLSTGGAVHRALAEYATLKEAHAAFHRTSADTVRRADAGTLEESALGEKGELKATLVRVCLAISRMDFKIG